MWVRTQAHHSFIVSRQHSMALEQIMGHGAEAMKCSRNAPFYYISLHHLSHIIGRPGPCTTDRINSKRRQIITIIITLICLQKPKKNKKRKKRAPFRTVPRWFDTGWTGDWHTGRATRTQAAAVWINAGVSLAHSVGKEETLCGSAFVCNTCNDGIVMKSRSRFTGDALAENASDQIV